MRRLIFSISIVFVIFLGNNVVNAQTSDVLDGIYEKEHVPARKPIPYHHLREADMMWTKKIWRILNLREKINHPLYYPTEGTIGDRMSLTNLIIWGVENTGMYVYDAQADDEFTTPMTLSELTAALGASADTQQIDINEYETVDSLIITEADPSEVKRYLMKEVWYFDKQRSKLEVQIVGLCPIRRFHRKIEGQEEDSGGKLSQTKVCWVYYPAARAIFANHEVINPKNDSERRTFEDIFFKRHFSSFIFKETNVYDNRLIQEYKHGLDARLESEKIKEFIFKLEHDLWEF